MTAPTLDASRTAPISFDVPGVGQLVLTPLPTSFSAGVPERRAFHCEIVPDSEFRKWLSSVGLASLIPDGTMPS